MSTMKSPPSSTPRRGWSLLSRSAAAVFGGYALASAAGLFVAAVMPQTRADAALFGIQLSFAIYALAVIWAFAEPDLRRVWRMLLGASALLGGVGGLLLRASA